ncbi:MAG: prepilin peptidase [Rhodospirillaceae bacterium]|nr:MAG: prepilin peptidase [Rhodospirillaceae bacterium]
MIRDMASIASLTPMAWISLAILVAGLAALSWIDLRTGYLPDPIQIVLAIAGLIVIGLGSPAGISWRLALAGAGINAAVFWSLRWVISRLKGREAMGLGDVKLVAVGGLWLGPWALPYIMAVGGLGTLAGTAVVSSVKRKALWRGEMPLGPGLAAGILGCFVAALLRAPWLRLGGP